MVSQEIDGEEGLPSSISSTIFMKYSSLKKTYRSLEAERDELSLKLKELCCINEELREALDESRKVEKFYNTCGAIADRELLRERLRAREERVASLTSHLEAQEATVRDLTGQLQWISATMAAKESFLCKEAGDLKILLDEKTDYISLLEEKLHSSGLVIQELEKLKQNYHLAYATVSETLLSYKSNFKAIASCSELLLMEKEDLQKEMSAKDTKIKQLSIFPQSPKTGIYLSQILHMIKVAEKSASDPDSESIFTLFPSIKRIVDTMKTELWNEESIEALIEMENVIVQTDYIYSTSSTQYELFFVEHKSVEADIPGQDFLNLKNRLELLERDLSEMERACLSKDELNKELEKQLDEAFAEKQKESAGWQEEVELQKEKLLILKGELDYNEALLDRSLEEIEKEVEARMFTSDQMNLSLQFTINEYEKSSEALDTLLVKSQEKIDAIENAYNEEVEMKMDLENDYIFRLQNEKNLLQEEIIQNKSFIESQNTEICQLRAELSEKSSRFKSVQEKLLKAEGLFERISSMDVSLRSNIFSDDSESDHLAAERTEKILNMIIEKMGMNDSQETLYKGNESSLDLDKLGLPNGNKKNLLKKNVKNLKDKIKKIKNALQRTRKKVKRTNDLYQKSSKELLDSKEFLGKVHKELACLSEKVFLKNAENEKIKIMLNEKDSKLDMLAYEKEKMEQVLLKIIKDMEKSLARQVKCKTVGIETDSECSEDNKIQDLTMKNKELSSLVTVLQGRIECLMNIPEKDYPSRESSSVGVQAEAKVAKPVPKDTGLVEKLKQDLNKERVLSNQRKITNNKLKESSERDLLSLKAEHRREISQLKDAFAKEKAEITAIHCKQIKKLNEKLEKLLNEKKLIEEKQKEICKTFLIEKDKKVVELTKLNEQVAEQKKYYEDLLCQRDRELEKEVKELKIEINNVIAKKEELIIKTKEACLVHRNHLKKKFKAILRRLKREKAAMLRKMMSLTHTLSKTKVEMSMDNFQADISEQNKSMSDSIHVTDAACQTVFFYTHCKKTDSSVQSIMSTNDIESQTGDDNCSLAEDFRDKSSDLNGKFDHVIFGTPSARKELSINFKERIKCSIQETKGTLVGAFFNKISHLTEVRDVALHRDKNELVSHVAYLENELLKKTEDFNRNVEMYQDTIRRQKSKVEELEKLLEEEVQDTYSLRSRLALEYNRAERLRLEKTDLQTYVNTLQRQIREHEMDCESEREKSNFWKSHFESSLNQRKTTDELEVSLKRLQDKVDTAVRYEKKILDDIKADEEKKERRSMALTTNDILRQIGQLSSASEFSRNSQQEVASSHERCSSSETRNPKTNKADFKVVLLQKCELLETWSRQDQPDDAYLGT